MFVWYACLVRSILGLHRAMGMAGQWSSSATTVARNILSHMPSTAASAAPNASCCSEACDAVMTVSTDHGHFAPHVALNAGAWCNLPTASSSQFDMATCLIPIERGIVITRTYCVTGCSYANILRFYSCTISFDHT